MRSAARRRSWAHVQILVTAAVLCGALPARADELTAVLRLGPGARDAALAERIRGQLSDLPVEIIESRERSKEETSLGAQIDAADRLGRLHKAGAVVWFTALPPRAPNGGVLVLVAAPDGGRVLVRRVEATPASDDGTPSTGELDSATLEAAALIVRTALRALAEGAVIGLERKDVAPTPPAPPLAPSARPPERSATSALAARSHWALSVGWRMAFDGDGVQQGLTGRAGYAVSRLSLGIVATQSMGVDFTDSYATFHVARHTVGAFVGLAAIVGREIELDLGGTAGAVLFDRSTLSVGDGVDPTPSRAISTAFFGLEARTCWYPRWAGGLLGVWISGGGELVPLTPSFGYNVGGQFVEARRPSLVQPTAGVGLTLRTQ